MFKLESYITPIILSHVEKYVKNVKAEQSQVSLWGGDVSFSNLDLRLDVLESELRLPFTFVSGHIHELQIHVPWTRLNTEPIVITINTIECVLKLPTDDDPAASESDACSTVSTVPGTASKNRRSVVSGEETPAAPPGYVQSLINKIISNVTIVCNNLILKYVEEDIVLSLNTRNLRLSSADELWRPAFTELSLPDLILRKLLQVTDMTICLDKRNASGKIETYQEPLLYRCSLSVHAAWVYDSLLSKIPTVSRYEVKCTRLDFSLTDTQMPMFMRIFKLALSLYFGEITSKRTQSNPPKEAVDGEGGADGGGGELGEEDFESRESWSGWAWNVGTSVGSALLPIYWEDEEGPGGEYGTAPPLDEMRDKVLHLGIFVDVASLVLKATMGQPQQSDKMFSPSASKLTFTPFARFDCAGVFNEVVARGAWSVNVRNGVSEVLFTPLGACVCGTDDASHTDPTVGEEQQSSGTSYLRCGHSKTRKYLSGSLFEKDFGSESGDQVPKERQRSYVLDWDGHLDALTEEKMLERTPAFAMDLLYHLELPEEMTSEQLSEFGLDLEYSDLTERSLCRFVIGPARLNVCSGLTHRILIINHFCSAYDYPPYSSLELEPSSPRGKRQRKQQPPSQEELDHLLQETPLRVYQLTAINPSVFLYHADHPVFQPKKLSSKRQARAAPLVASSGLLVHSRPINSLPGVALKMECFDVQFSHPMYPCRVARAASSFPFAESAAAETSGSAAPPSLMKSCHSNLTAKVMQLSSQLFFGEQSTTVMPPCSFQVGWKSLQMPQFWTDRVVVLSEYFFDLNATMKAKLTRPQTMVLQHVVSSYLDESIPRPGKLCDTTILEDALTKRMTGLVFSAHGIRTQFSCTEHIRTVQVGVESVSASLNLVGKDSSHLLPILSRGSPSGGGAAPHHRSSFTSSPVKSSPGRALTRTKLSYTVIDATNSGSELFIAIHAQFPAGRESQRSCPSLLNVNIVQLDCSIDPKCLEWFLYFPQMKSSVTTAVTPSTSVQQKRTAEVKRVREKSVGSSDGGGRQQPKSSAASDDPTKARFPSAKSLRTSERIAGSSLKRRAAAAAGVTVTRRSSGALVEWLRLWYPTLNSMLVQVRVDRNRVFFPRKTLFDVGVGCKTVSECIQLAKSCKEEEFPMFTVILPSLIIENTTHKPSLMLLYQYISATPIMVPENVFNWKRDNLPWTLKLDDFMIFSEGSEEERGNKSSKSTIFEATATSCTLGLTTTTGKGETGGSSVALCVHTDMSAVKLQVADGHLTLLIHLMEEAIGAATKLIPSLLIDEDTVQGKEFKDQSQPTAAQGQLSSPEGSSVAGMSAAASGRPIADSISDTLTASQLISDVVEGADPPVGDTLSLWLQWTVPAVTLALLTRDGDRRLKLQFDAEECQSSFDWTPIYFKLKFRVLSANLKCFSKSGDSNWVDSANMGVVVSSAEDLSHDIMFVNPVTNNVEILPHTRHFEGDGSVFSFVYTCAESNSVRRKWKEVLRKKHASSPATRAGAPNVATTVTTATTGTAGEVEEKDMAGDGGAGAAGSGGAESRFVSEIDLKFAPIDIVVSPPEVMPFFKMITRLFAMKVPRRFSLASLLSKPAGGSRPTASHGNEVVGLGINNNTLPLVYLRAKTLRLFLLSGKAPSATSHAALSPDFVLFQVETATISPQAENPLSRVLLRPDLYHMARPVLGIPGSHIEDRQYEINMSGVGVYTGSWSDLMKKSEKPPKPLLRTMGENPAFEWNTMKDRCSSGGGSGERLPFEVMFFPCLSKFDLQVTFAPAIVLEQQRRQPKLVAGHSIEFNATTAISLFLSLNQIGFCSSLFQETAENLRSLYARVVSVCVTAAGVPLDSGVDCDLNSSMQSKDPGVSAQNSEGFASTRRFVPTEVLVTGSNISWAVFRLSEGEKGEAPTAHEKNMWRKFRYKQRRGEIAEQRSLQLQASYNEESGSESRSRPPLPSSDGPLGSRERRSLVDGYEASEEESAMEERHSRANIKIHPLLHIGVSQPHAFLSCSKLKQRFDVSFFDGAVATSPPDYFITGGGRRLPERVDFPLAWFHTKKGDADPRTGIPPALFTATLSDFLVRPCVVDIAIERPLKFVLASDLLDNFTTAVAVVREACDFEALAACLSQPTGDKSAEKKHKRTATAESVASVVDPLEEAMSAVRGFAANFTSIKVATKQIVLQFPFRSGGAKSGEAPGTGLCDADSARGRNRARVLGGVMGLSCTANFQSKGLKSRGRGGILDSVTLKTELDKLLVRIGIGDIAHNFVNPWSPSAKLTISWLSYSPVPVLHLTLVSEMLHLKLGPNHVIAMRELQERLSGKTGQDEAEGKGRLQSPSAVHSSPPPVPPPPPPHSPTPSSVLSVGSGSTFSAPGGEQHYVDDLRAGAFQYVTGEGGPDAEGVHEPKPYQVVFSSRPPAMTWRYPQPRTLTRVTVFPVPFMSASESGRSPESGRGREWVSEEGSKVSCALQYWDNCLGLFMTYSEFTLSELNVSHLNLPTVGDRKRCAVSATWRVLLNHEDYVDEDDKDFEQVDTRVIVTPKSLVSVIRVDSYFKATLIPRLQASIEIPAVAVEFFNHLHYCGRNLPKSFGSFTLNQNFPLEQSIGSVSLDSVALGLDTWFRDSKGCGLRANLRFKSRLSVRLTDFAFLSSHYLIDPTKFQGQFGYSSGDNSLDLNISSKPIHIRLGHFARHTLDVAAKVWNGELDNSRITDFSAADMDIVPPTKFVICNSTQEPVRFGQADTEENILLKPTEAMLYSWRSQKARLVMRLCVEGGYWKWCEPFPLSDARDTDSGKRDIVLVRTIDHTSHKITLVVTIRRVRPTQYQVIISGLLTTASLIKDHLEVRVVMRTPGEHHQPSAAAEERRTVLGSFTAAPSFVVGPDRVQGVKIRLLGIGTPWSGEIPLHVDKGRRNSVLVRIPTKEKGMCVTVWCREEELIGHPQVQSLQFPRSVEEKHGDVTRCLLLFSPMYMARSLLPNPMKVLVSSSSAQTSSPHGGGGSYAKSVPVQFELPGREKAVQLETLGPSDLKYSVAFKVVEGLPPSDPIAMSWGIIEQVREKCDLVPSIDEVIRQVPSFADSSKSTWPFIASRQPVDSWVASEQPKTDVQVNFTQFHPLCNTLCLDINPWCLIVNQLGITLVLKDEDSGGVFSVEHDSVLVPPHVASTFCLGIHVGGKDGEVTFSPPLRISDQEWRFRQLMPSVHGVIPMEGIVQTKIVLDSQICFMTIHSKNEHGMRIVHVKPTFLMSNLTKEALLCAPISVLQIAKRVDMDKLDFVVQDIAPDSDSVTPLLFWQIVGEQPKSFDGMQHIALSTPHTEWSMPVNFEDSRNIEEDRKCSLFMDKKQSGVSVVGSSNISLSMTTHQRDGQVFFVVSENLAPALTIHNGLERPIRLGQGMKNYGLPLTSELFVGERFQMLRSQSSCFYAMPWLEQNFPFKDGVEDPPRLLLSAIDLYNRGDEGDLELAQDIVSAWSSGVDVTESHEEFLHLPGHGDVKIAVEVLGDSSAHVFVDLVSKMELSAKDIRSRIPSGSRLDDVVSPSPSYETSHPCRDPTSTTMSPTSGAADESFQTLASFAASPRSDLDISFKTAGAGVGSRYHSFAEDSTASANASYDLASAKGPAQLDIAYALFIEEVSVALTDDCYENPCEGSEYLRVTVNSFAASGRPYLPNSTPLRCSGQSPPRRTDLRVTVGSLQVDNQMFSRRPFDFPVVLLGEAEAQEAQKIRVPPVGALTDEVLETLRDSCMLSINLQFEAAGHSVGKLRSVRVRSAPLCANIEDKLIFEMSAILNSFSYINEDDECSHSVAVVPGGETGRLPHSILMASRNLVEQLSLQEILIEPIEVSLSVHASVKMYVGLDQSPLNFSSFSRSRLLTTNYCLGEMLARHYISGALFRAGWVVGSLDLIGSPSGFTRTVGSGIKDFVALPFQGLFNGPWAFAGGIANGSTSLVKHVSAGTLTSVTNFASSVSRNMDRLSLDDEHCQRNEISRRERPRGFGQGLMNGLSGVGISLLGAVGGVAHHPISAIVEQGLSPSGMVGGITRGIVGVVTKPLGGAAEFISQTGHGLLVGTGWSRDHKCKYPPMPDHACSFVSGPLKYSWKLLAGSNFQTTAVLSVADVNTSSSAAATLVLTQEAIFVISGEEDVQESVHSVRDIECLECPDDPTKLSIVTTRSRHELDGGVSTVLGFGGAPSVGPESSAKDRVAQFVMETGMHCTVSDLESETDNNSESKTKSGKAKKRTAIGMEDSGKGGSEASYYASPVARSAFLAMFEIVKRQTAQKGFDML